MKVFHARTEGKPSELRSETFSGTVWADPVMPATDGVMINNVFFAPGERHWHGAAADSYMIHMATSMGKTTWAEAVSQQDYVS
jgi:quercetin dioxygenase-like cupin family protein